MENFIAIDIFDTKGTEYIFVIGYLLLLVLVWQLMNRPVRVFKRVREGLGVLTDSILRIPQGLFYSRNHTWAHLNKSGVASVGLDDLLQHITGAARVRYLKTSGENIKKGEALFELEKDGKVLKVYSPISGEVISPNEMISENQEVLSQDPYGTGWVYKIQPVNWINDTRTYMLAEDASAWIKNEFSRFKDFLAVSMKKHSPEKTMIVMQDGGELRDNVLTDLPSEIWSDFQNSFLQEP